MDKQGVLTFLLIAVAPVLDAQPLDDTLSRLRTFARGGGLAEPRSLGSRNPKCESVAFRLLPPPTVKKYNLCFNAMMRPNSTHDWSSPGAEVAAQFECWCANNMTTTMEQYGCCNHSDVAPMCSVNCKPDCQSPFAQSCIKSCPPMCLESAEYMSNKCDSCNFAKCWSVLGCLTKHASKQPNTGAVAPTCREKDFQKRSELQEYWKCWRSAPKHTSHWNVLSSIVHCICREGMQDVTRSTGCCTSLAYGGGICDLRCTQENECVTPEAQTCIQGCQVTCPAVDIAPSAECMKRCLATDAPCRKYVACRAPISTNFICDDGRWPEASSGCCVDKNSGNIGCPKLCETERITRFDRAQGIPWWTRWHIGRGVIAQCTCGGCPKNETAGLAKLTHTVEGSLWENGQRMLLEIAQREGLLYGPNRQMQELMAKRNADILQSLKNPDGQNTERRIAMINEKYSGEITSAARMFGDDPMMKATGATTEEDNRVVTFIVIGSCTLAILIAVALSTCLIMRNRRLYALKTGAQTWSPDCVVVGIPAGSEAAQPDEGKPGQRTLSIVATQTTNVNRQNLSGTTTSSTDASLSSQVRPPDGFQIVAQKSTASIDASTSNAEAPESSHGYRMVRMASKNSNVSMDTSTSSTGALQSPDGRRMSSKESVASIDALISSTEVQV